MPYHKLLDQARESKISGAIGTTGRGIGPAYIDKARRIGIRIVDLLDKKCLEEKLRKNIEEKNAILNKIYGYDMLDIDEILNSYLHFDELIDPYVTDTTLLLYNAINENKNIIIEGAQGALLDVDHGTYPFVTSSNPTSGGACTGLGIPPTAIDKIIGIVKAYCTRVGNGPFPTELDNEMGERIRTAGVEFGSTTGRPRRCGWLDLVALKYSQIINGFDEIALTKLDVLNDLEEIKICTSYRLNDKPLKSFPVDLDTLEKLETVYETLPGWKMSLSGIKSYDDLPNQVKEYIELIENVVGVRVSIISTSPDREDTIIRT